MSRAHAASGAHTHTNAAHAPLQVVSISLAGAAVGSLSGSILADALGRSRAFVLDALPLLAGAALCATAQDVNAIIAGRALVGLGIGLSSALVPLYISEVAPTSIRGQLGTVNQLMICVGILVALVINVVLPVTAWRTMFWISAVPAVLLGLGARLRCLGSMTCTSAATALLLMCCTRRNSYRARAAPMLEFKPKKLVCVQEC